MNLREVRRLSSFIGNTKQTLLVPPLLLQNREDSFFPEDLFTIVHKFINISVCILIHKNLYVIPRKKKMTHPIYSLSKNKNKKTKIIPVKYLVLRHFKWCTQLDRVTVMSRDIFVVERKLKALVENRTLL